MPSWPWGKGTQVTESSELRRAQKAHRRALMEGEVVESNWNTIDHVASRLDAEREANHFAERIRLAFGAEE